MPTRPPSRCSWPQGCTDLATADGRCPSHPRPRWAPRPGAPRAGMRTAAGRRLNARVLAEEPTCRACWRAAATEVDHVRAIALGGARTARSNLQGLCHPCHASKTAADRAAVTAARRAAAIATFGDPPF